MNIRVVNQKFLGPASILVSIAGILFLCQPWVQLLHAWSVLVMLIGLISFNVSVHIPPPVLHPDDDDSGTVPGVKAVGGSHG